MNVTPLEDWILERTSISGKSKTALEGYQLDKIISTLEYAREKSKYYKSMLQNIDINSFRSIRDIVKIPFTLPEDIHNNPYDFLCVSEKNVKRIVTLDSTGTTGNEKRIFFTEKDLDYTIDFFQYGMNCLIDNRDHVLVLLPGKAYGSIGDLLNRALTKSNIQCIVHGTLTDLNQVERIIIQNNITCIVGIPMQVLYFSRIKSNIFSRYIKKVLLSTDYVPDVLVRELTINYNCRVFNHYGMTEMGYGGGVECEALDGYHLREGDIYFEIINPETGHRVEDGQYGEVVFTTLNRQAMPLIRYRTGDVARFYTEICPCGTFLRTMGKVIGRMSNKVVLKNEREIHLRVLDEILLDVKDILDYRASLIEGDKLELLLILRNENDIDTIEKQVRDILYDRLNFKIQLVVNHRKYNEINKITNSMFKRVIYDLRK